MSKIHSPNHHEFIVTANHVAHEVHPDYFDASYWQQKNQITGSSVGRNTTWFFQLDQLQYVLRHYYRGGMIGKLLNDTYVFTSVTKTRAFRELHLLEQLSTMGLNAPKPFAAYIKRQGLYYRADLITQRIEGAQDIFHILQAESLHQQQWMSIGHTIRQFHDKGIYHADLNIHNILMDDKEDIWLIDFDRGEQRKLDDIWPQANLDRLLRSLNKEKNLQKRFYWQKKDWESLLEGYHGS